MVDGERYVSLVGVSWAGLNKSRCTIEKRCVLTTHAGAFKMNPHQKKKKTRISTSKRHVASKRTSSSFMTV